MKTLRYSIIAITVGMIIVTVLHMSPLPPVYGQAVGTQVSPFDFQLDESAVDGKRYSYLTGPGPAAIIKQNETKSLPVIILPATDKLVSVKFHVTTGNNQTGPIQIPLGVRAIVEPSEITVKSHQNQTINIIVSADKNAPYGKYVLNIVGEWPGENGFVGSSIVINIGKDFGPNVLPYNFQWTPLKQYQSGTAVKDIRCDQDLQLILKSEDGSPACVKPDSISKLVLSGWAKNPLSELLLKYVNQTQANIVFYNVMNEPQVKHWSMTGWMYNSYEYASVGDPQKFSATIRLYLPQNDSNHPECKNGSNAFVVMNLKPVEIEHNYTQVGCMPDYKDWNLGSNLK